jgi:hypothetical protein
VPFVRNGCLVREETIAKMSERGAELQAMPGSVRELDGEASMYPGTYSECCWAALEAVEARAAQ